MQFTYVILNNNKGHDEQFDKNIKDKGLNEKWLELC